MQAVKEQHFTQPNNLKISITTAFKKLLNAVKISKCRILLSSAVDIYITAAHEIESIELSGTLKPFIRYTTSDNQLNTLHIIQQMCFNTVKFTVSQRYKIAKDILPVLIQNSYYSVFEQFYTSIITSVLSTLDRKNDCAGFSIVQTVNKTITFILIELLFSRIKIEGFEDNTCPISKAAFPNELPSEKKLLKVLTQSALQVYKENYNLHQQEEKDIFRLYQCHSYNALVSLISNTQKEITHYNWLFVRESDKRDILWHKLVDTDKKYTFGIDFDTVPSMKKVLVNIRSDLHAAKKKVDPNIHTVKYIESQHLFNSTLTEDITRFDFTHSMVRSQPEQAKSAREKIETKPELQVTLESLPINDHECMATVCGLIQHLIENEISPLPTENETVSLPKWMKGLRNVMMAESTHPNVKIFLVNIIQNTQDIFKLYAKWFLSPVIKVIVDGCLGNSINFLTGELVIMLTSWSQVAVPSDDRILASELLKFLLINADSDRRNIFKYNLELIKLVVETWKSCLDVPYDIIYSKLQLDVTSQKLDVGVHLVAVLLANNIAPWRQHEVKDFLMTLTKVIKSDHRSVYQPCAEVLGMSLQYMSADADSAQHLNKFQDYLHKWISKLTDDDKFAYCLQGIVLHHPIMADKYLCRLVSKLAHVHGNFKCIYLKIFLARIEMLQSINELSSINFQKLLVEENLEIQVLTLQIIEKSIQHLKPPELRLILQDISQFVNSTFTVCRTVMYDIFMTTFSLYSQQQNEILKEVTQICRDILLQGLVDKELTIQERIFKFWLDGGYLPTNISQSFLYLLNDMYKASIEEHYIGYSTFMLLNMLKSTEEFSEKLFEHALYDCDFHDYALINNWRRQHASIAPLFADTLRSQESDMNLMNPNILRATVSTLEFQPTQAPASAVTQRPTYFTNPVSSLLFNTTADSSNDNQSGIFKDPNIVLPKYSSIRGRRFLRDQSKISRHCAYLEVRKSFKAEEARKERVKQSERNVTVYRKYRIGDYPDIEITLSSIITPLQELVKCDANLARHLYACLFTSLLNKIQINEAVDSGFIQNIKVGIDNIFSNSTQFIPNTIGTFLDIALMYKGTLQFHPYTITNVCQASGLLSVGSLLLEEYIISEVDYETPAKKRKGMENENIVYWVKLAELYKDMDEWDVVSAIFMEKMNCGEAVLNAIEAESLGHWRSAQEFYATVIQEENSQERKDFYYESYFKCFAALAEWDKISDVIQQTVVTNSEDSVWTSLWNDDWNQQKLLPWYITAELRNTLNGADRKLFSYFNECLSSAEKLEYLKSNFGEELAMLYLLQNDIGSTNYYIKNTLTNFLENWSHLNPLFVKLRVNKVLNLRNTTDINLFIKLSEDIKPSNAETALDIILKSWQNSAFDSMESLILSETRTVYRNQFASFLRAKLESLLNVDQIQNKTESFRKCKFKLHMGLIESALHQGNYYVARKYIKLSSKPNQNSIVEKMQWSLAISKVLYLRAQSTENGKAKLSLMMDSWSQIGVKPSTSITEDSAVCYLIDTNKHIFNLTKEISQIVAESEPLFNENRENLQRLANGFLMDNVTAISNFGMITLKKAIEHCENEIENMMNSDNLKAYKHMADAYVQLAYYSQNREGFEKDFILCVLRAMKLGSAEGRQLFPCLLNRDIGTTFKDTFIEESTHIPTWMFLGWLPQLLANLDTPCIFVISNILVQIAKVYPQAIMYPYRVSKEKYSFKSDEIGVKGQEIAKELDNLLFNDDLTEKFLKALACVSTPTNILRYHIGKLKVACNSEEEFNVVLQHLFSEVYSTNSDYRDANSFQGTMFKKIAKYETKIRNAFKGKFSAATYPNILNTLDNELRELKFDRSTRLFDYSPWLANFQGTEQNRNLEIPGQYTGEKRPLVQYHVKIMGFSATVLPLSSLRAPIRLTVLGNNAKEYHYLVKFGEDLRQDQRIEQIFNLMNNVLSHDVNCSKRQLHICTYQVIPLNSRLGIIEWVDNTKELQKFIKDAISDQTEKKNWEKSSSEYESWIQKAVPRTEKNKGGPAGYGYACSKYSRNDTICKYQTLVNNLSLDILRKSFWNISVNSESFFALRHKFATSYGVMCISQWLLGIGDRHLLNSLISVNSGEVIGIDFGHAFGTATQILPIPELVPFRLTPHILHLLQPLNEKGLLQETMIHCLRAYRKHRDMLLATMNVFVKEPSLDWLEFARRSELTSRHSLTQEWYPNQKILHAERKLQGANPTSIMIEELKAGHSHTKFVDAYIKVVKGNPSHDFRANKGDDLSEEDQVKCLLDQATDYNLLGRMYVGWMAWV